MTLHVYSLLRDDPILSEVKNYAHEVGSMDHVDTHHNTSLVYVSLPACFLTVHHNAAIGALYSPIDVSRCRYFRAADVVEAAFSVPYSVATSQFWALSTFKRSSGVEIFFGQNMGQTHSQPSFCREMTST